MTSRTPAFPSSPPLSGFLDKRVGSRGETYQRRVASDRVKAWASVAAAEDELRLLDDRLSGELGRNLAPVWTTLRDRDHYLSGEAKPNRSTVDRLAVALPLSRRLYDSTLWVALDASTDLRTLVDLIAACRRQLGVTDSELYLEGDRPKLLIEDLYDGRHMACLVASMRVNERDERLCFDAALGLLRAMLAWSLIGGMKDAAEVVWGLLKDTLLDGMAAGNREIRIADDYWSHICGALTNRLAALLSATGRIRLKQRHDAWPSSFSITLFWPLVQAITAPEACEEGEIKDVFAAFDGDTGRAAWLEKHRLVVAREQYVRARAPRAKAGQANGVDAGSAISSLFRG